MSDSFTVAVVGASGAVGEAMVRVLEERAFPVKRLLPLASERSAGRSVRFRGAEVPIEALGADSFQGVDLALFSAGARVSVEHAPRAVAAGAIVVDNSSAFRMEEGVPLVVPEVNADALARHRGIIANPNCSTIQMVVALKPLHDAAGLRRVIVSTYQSASGKGAKGVWELKEQTAALVEGREPEVTVHPRRLAWNVIPHIDTFLPDGSTKEEWKMVVETRKILGLPDLPVQATCVRVPVLVSHSEAVVAEFARDLPPEAAREILRGAPGVVVMDDPANGIYPTPIDAEGKDPCYVGRIRRDPSVAHGLAFWVVADNVRKGAATNAVQIAERLFDLR